MTRPQVELPDLVNGKPYRITHQSPTQRYPRYSILRYLGQSIEDTFWDARPAAGTQTFPKAWIKEINPLVEGREKPCMNKRA